MRRPSVVLVPDYVRQPPPASYGDADMVGPSAPAGPVQASFSAALASAICSAASAVPTPSTTTTTTTTTTTDDATSEVTHSVTADCNGKEVEHMRAYSSDDYDDGEYRRKWTVLVSSIVLIMAFNFFYVLILSITQLVVRSRLPCGLHWLYAGSWPFLTPMSASDSNCEGESCSFDGNHSACVFAVFVLLCNVYHTSLLVLLYRTKRLYLVATLFLIYIDLGVCCACLYFGIVTEFYMWLAAVVAMAYYIFGRQRSRLFLIAVILEGVALYPCSVYLFPPVAPLSVDPLGRLAATCTMMLCIGLISHVHESSRQATLERLRESNEQLRRSTEAKTLFLSAITHELRTPLTGIIGMANELLLDDEDGGEDDEEKSRPASPSRPDQDEQCHQRSGSRQHHRAPQSDEERMEAVRIIVTCARHLLGLVNDVLDFEKIESRQLDLESIPFDVEKEADLVVSMLAYPAAASHVRIEKRVALDNATRVGDPLRFRQVLFNLLSNAIKFTPAAGTVELELSDAHQTTADCAQEDAAGHEGLRVEVRDTGIGISESVMKNLFKHFSQGGTGVCRQYGGSGLGLAICKHLVEAMQGQIGCSSPGKDKGSTFWFTLPLPVATSEEAVVDTTQVAACDLAAGPSPSPSSPSGNAHCDTPHPQHARHCFEGMKVLLVEDNVVNQKVGRRLLERIGCDVKVAENGQECIEMLEREHFSLIFMDCQMPVLDGYEATRRIREKERAEQRGRIPIVALTASCVKSDRQVCLDSGMDDWMSKPFDQTALCNALLKWARQPHSQAER